MTVVQSRSVNIELGTFVNIFAMSTIIGTSSPAFVTGTVESTGEIVASSFVIAIVEKSMDIVDITFVDIGTVNTVTKVSVITCTFKASVDIGTCGVVRTIVTTIVRIRNTSSGENFGDVTTLISIKTICTITVIPVITFASVVGICIFTCSGGTAVVDIVVWISDVTTSDCAGKCESGSINGTFVTIVTFDTVTKETLVALAFE